MAHHATAHANGHGNEVRTYMLTLGALLILTAITVAASWLKFGSGMINVIVALTIATIKASLVALFFMHLRNDKPVNATILLSSFFFLGLFLVSCYTDYVSRVPLQPATLKIATPAPNAGGSAPPAGQTTPAPATHH